MTDPRLSALAVLADRFCLDPDAGESSTRIDSGAVSATLRPDGTWADIVYREDSLRDWTAAEHLRRLQAMALAWRRPDSPCFRDERMRAACVKALEGWYAQDPKNPNWWWNQIGAPLLLGRSLLCLKGAVDPALIARAEPAFRAHEPIIRFTGENLVWTATVMLYHGILADDPDRVTQAFILIERETRVFPDDEGVQPDMSFHQHGKLLYSGGYGQGFACDVARLVACASGTVYAWRGKAMDRLFRLVLDGTRWMVRGRRFDPGVIGREITRPNHEARGFYKALSCLSQVDHPRREEARASAAVDPKKGQSLVTGNRFFWKSDFMVQHRPDYSLSVRVPSPRVLNADGAHCGGEGRLCHHIADGATFIRCDGEEYRDIFPVWNWRQVPGTTAVQDDAPFDPAKLRRLGEKTFAGGASDGSVGCAAVDFSRDGLAARKAWFLFDDGLVALGTGIRHAGDAPVCTTLNQCRWTGPVYLGRADAPVPEGVLSLTPGSAFWHGRVLYRILDGRGTLRLGTQSGAWNDCGVGDPEPVKERVLNAWLNHGAKPDGATYAYRVQPGVEAEAAFGEDAVRILSNTPALQAVWHEGEQRGHAVFYESGRVEFPDGLALEADRPCLVLYRPEAERRLVFTVAQPEQLDGLLTLRLRERARATLAVSLPAHEYAGSSVTLVFKPE